MANPLTFARQEEFETIRCGECGIVFAIEAWLKTKWVNERHAFVCPNGHHRQFAGETDAERIKRELTAQLDAARREAEWERVRHKDAMNRERAMKGHITKLKKRISAGVCPCCHRTFKQLAAHMAGQHPDYVRREEPEAVVAVDPHAASTGTRSTRD